MFSIRSIRLSRPGRKLLLATTVALGVSACGITQKLRPYSIDIRQGNYVTQEMAAQLTPGMTQEQVRFVMGSPLLVDPFHANRWDYVYSYAPGGKTTETRRVTLLFKDSKLSSVEGDVIATMPAAQSSAASSAPSAQNTPSP
jgi:outer membrane protein assembly factor BamE